MGTIYISSQPGEYFLVITFFLYQLKYYITPPFCFRNESYECSLEWIGRVEEVSQAGPAPIVDTGEYCTSLASHVLEFYLHEMNQDGFIQDAYEQFLNTISTYQCPLEDSSYFDEANEFELSMKDLGGIFSEDCTMCYVCAFV